MRSQAAGAEGASRELWVDRGWLAPQGSPVEAEEGGTHVAGAVPWSGTQLEVEVGEVARAVYRKEGVGVLVARAEQAAPTGAVEVQVARAALHTH